MRTLAAVLAVLLVLPATAAAPGWRDGAAPFDISRVERLGPAWTAALAQARRTHGPEVKALGALADPARALPAPLPPPGVYRCRTLKFGSTLSDDLGFVPYGWFRCRVERSPGGELSLSKFTGSQRFFGVLYPDGPRRLVFLGAGSFGDEGWVAYRSRPDRDQTGVLERVEAGRWRLALPWPQYESKLDLIELKR